MVKLKRSLGMPWWREWPLLLAVVTLLLAIERKAWVAGALNDPPLLIGLLVVLCAVILIAAIAIVRHADILAHRLGEPGGTLLLTLAVTGLEVAMVTFVMATGKPKPMLARDTMFAVVMLVLNGLMGLSLLLGGLRHREQPYNLQGANAFLVMILPLTVLGLILPNFTRDTVGPTLSIFQMIFLSVMSLAIYGIFLFVQNRRHKGFFIFAEESVSKVTVDGSEHSSHSSGYHSLMLVFYGLPLVLLAKQMAGPLDAMVNRLGAPEALGGFVMAVLVLTPEAIAAVRAAQTNQLQRSVNILMGSVLASIGLTIPMVIAVSIYSGRSLVLGSQAKLLLCKCGRTLCGSTAVAAAARRRGCRAR